MVLLQFVLQLRVGLRYSIEQLICLIGDLNAKHPYRAENDREKRKEGNYCGPSDREPGVPGQPVARAPQQDGEKDPGENQQDQIDRINGRPNEADDQYGNEHSLPKSQNLGVHIETECKSVAYCCSGAL